MRVLLLVRTICVFMKFGGEGGGICDRVFWRWYYNNCRVDIKGIINWRENIKVCILITSNQLSVEHCCISTNIIGWIMRIILSNDTTWRLLRLHITFGLLNTFNLQSCRSHIEYDAPVWTLIIHWIQTKFQL